MKKEKGGGIMGKVNDIIKKMDLFEIFDVNLKMSSKQCSSFCYPSNLPFCHPFAR